MKRTVFIITAFLAVLSCTRTQDLDVPEAAQDAVGFDVYTHGALETKAGYPGEINLDVLKVTGFGVYGYVSTKPDFMANQHVTYSGGWVYSPVKYWPNQDGVDIDFYAYAPYVEQSDFATLDDAQTDAASATPAKEGIVYVHPNNVATSPKIVYRTPADPSNSVDLMYGVAAEAHTNPDVTVGLPFLNMTKLKLGEKMKFNFKHALTKLVVNVDGIFDEVNSGNNEVDANTRVVIKSVNIKTTQLAVGGTLDLNNSVADTPSWTVGTTLSAYNDNAGYDLPVASNLKYVTGNDATVTHFSQQPLGVTKTVQSLMGYGIDGTTAASLLFVPNGAAADLTISITYEVITRDPNLGKGYNRTENPITQTISAANLGSNAFKPGYATTLNLHLGLASVKFDAEITNWESGATENVDLPVNEAKVYTYSAGPSTKIQIAPCNLMYKHSNNSWSLTEKPWTLVETGSTVSINYGHEGESPEDISLFGWGTASQPWLTSGTNSVYGPATGDLDDNHNWGTNVIAGLSGSGWRVPTLDEWVYLLSYDSGNTARYNQYGLGRIEIANETYVNGLFILPDADSWTDPFPSRPFTLGYRTNHTTYNQYSASDWSALSLAGVVFLPVAGMRLGSANITDVYASNVSGAYWSSTRLDNTNAHWLSISNAITPNACTDLNRGASIRLIRE